MIVLVAGGTGFVGRHVVRLLRQEGHDVIVHHRGHRTVPTYADAIVNCVGIIKETYRQTFWEAHVEKTRWLLKLGKKLDVRQFVQISAIGADLEGTPYQRTKRQAEIEVERSGLPYAIIRPSMLWGDEDRSINLFRSIARTGFFPLVANGKVQPLHVNVLAQVVGAAVKRRIRNRIVEIGGPETLTYAQLADRLHPGVTIFALPRIGARFLGALGAIFPPLPTQDMLLMMEEDNVTRDKTIERLKIPNPRLR